MCIIFFWRHTVHIKCSWLIYMDISAYYTKKKKKKKSHTCHGRKALGSAPCPCWCSIHQNKAWFEISSEWLRSDYMGKTEEAGVCDQGQRLSATLPWWTLIDTLKSPEDWCGSKHNSWSSSDLVWVSSGFSVFIPCHLWFICAEWI